LELSIILLGVAAGVVAKLMTSGRGPGGLLINIAIATAGALGAAYLGQAAGIYQVGESDAAVGALLGAFVLLVIYHLFTKTRGQ
jgi:uncharacterized membrane protein YeaQ/YmgE (transglycosylase-associated protein family)